MLENLAFSIWFLLPAGIANLIPVFAAKIPFLKKFDAPIDGGRKYKGSELFGSHKTWRGLISGIIIATLVFWIQQKLVLSSDWAKDLTSSVDYLNFPIFFGSLLGLGALAGDAIESFFKRRRGIKSGHSWVPFDQIDYILGSLLLSLPLVILDIYQYLLIILVWFLLHLVTSYIGYLLKLKSSPI